METKQPLQELAKVLPPDTPVAPAHAIGAIALQMAMQWHDISTVKDGTLYQQYKLEGRNMMTLHLDMVFETAIAMEKHLLGTSDRIAKLIFDAVIEVVDDEDPTHKSPVSSPNG